MEKILKKSRLNNDLKYDLINFHKELGFFISKIKTKNYDLNKIFDYAIELNKIYVKYNEVE